MLKPNVFLTQKYGVDNINKGFSRVYVTGDIPYNFMTVDSSGENIAYLVSLDYVGCDEMSTGRDYKDFEEINGYISSTPVVFGEDDVYVYDSTGTLFYVRGFKDNGKTHHGQIENKEIVNIVNVTKEFINNKEEVKVTITIESNNEIDCVKAKLGNIEKEASSIGDGKYEVIIDKNGNYEIIAEDKNGNIDKEELRINGIGSEGDLPEVVANVINGTLAGDHYKVSEETAEIQLQITKGSAKYLYISSTNEDPDSWLPYTDKIEKTYTTDGEKVLYIWVKDENDISCDSPFVLKINVELENVNKPIRPDEDVQSGDIDFLVIPGNTVWANNKQVIITFTEGMQFNGYQSEYRTKSGLSDWGRWTTSYENIVKLDVTRNTQIEARIIYSSDYKNVVIATGSETVEKIDTIPPKVTSLNIEKINGINIIKGEGNDSDSGLHSTPYFISTQLINFKYLTDDEIDNYEWKLNNSMEIRKDAKYYFYVRDKANNVGYGSVNAEASDTDAPVIEEITAKRILDYCDVRIVAIDNIGIVEWAIVINDTETKPTEWKNIADEKQILLNYNGLKEDCDVTVWIKDGAGNESKATVRVTTNKFPILDGEFPKNLYIKEDDVGKFEVVITKVGDPDEYEWQWQESTDGEVWTNIQGATEQIYTFTAKNTDNNKFYRAQITHPRGIMYSPTAQLQVAVITKATPNMTVTEDEELIAGGVVINKGAIQTNNPKLSLDIVALNAAQMSISETEEQGNWQPYKNSVEFTLKNTTPGTKNIKVWVMDSVGNVSEMNAQIDFIID